MCTKSEFITFVDTPQNYFWINFGVLQTILTFLFYWYTVNQQDGSSMYKNQVMHDLFLKNSWVSLLPVYVHVHVYLCTRNLNTGVVISIDMK